MSNQSANTCDRRLPPLIFHRLASLRERVAIKKESREHKKTPDPFNLHPCCSKNCRQRRGISSRPSGVGGVPGRRPRFCLHRLLHPSSIAQDEERRADRVHVLRGDRHGQCHRGFQKCASSKRGVAFLSLGFDRRGTKSICYRRPHACQSQNRAS